jgi:hypothetical protein
MRRTKAVPLTAFAPIAHREILLSPEMTSRPAFTPPAIPALALAATVAAVILAPGCREAPRFTAYDLAADVWIAEWIGPGSARLIAAPPTEIDYRRPRAVAGATSGARSLVLPPEVREPDQGGSEARSRDLGKQVYAAIKLARGV